MFRRRGICFWIGVACMVTGVLIILALGFMGCMVQSNSIGSTIQTAFGIPAWVSGIILVVICAIIFLGGVQRLAAVTEKIVPIMAAIFLLGGLVILCARIKYVPATFGMIFKYAFEPQAIVGGSFGYAIKQAISQGAKRGLFSNESGLGSAPIVAAAAQTRNPVRQALVSSTGTFWDTVIICALTGLVITSSIIAYPDIDYHNGAALTKAAFSKIPYIGAPLLTFGLSTFAFSTTLGWSYYGERCVEYLKGKKWMLCYRMLYIISIFIGSVISLGLVWNIADCMNALMAIPNLVSLLCLSGIIVHETRKYLWRDRLDRDMDESEIEELE